MPVEVIIYIKKSCIFFYGHPVNDFTALIFVLLFFATAAGVVPCGSPKKRPRTSSIVQFIFYFWSFEISRNILRNQKILYV